MFLATNSEHFSQVCKLYCCISPIYPFPSNCYLKKTTLQSISILSSHCGNLLAKFHKSLSTVNKILQHLHNQCSIFNDASQRNIIEWDWGRICTERWYWPVDKFEKTQIFLKSTSSTDLSFLKRGIPSILYSADKKPWNFMLTHAPRNRFKIHLNVWTFLKHKLSWGQEKNRRNGTMMWK